MSLTSDDKLQKYYVNIEHLHSEWFHNLTFWTKVDPIWRLGLITSAVICQQSWLSGIIKLDTWYTSLIKKSLRWISFQELRTLLQTWRQPSGPCSIFFSNHIIMISIFEKKNTVIGFKMIFNNINHEYSPMIIYSFEWHW